MTKVKKIRKFVVDFDDYCDATVGELRHLERIKEQYEDFKVTLFTIPHPSRTSDETIQRAKDLGSWISLAPHGWHHTRGECLSWSQEEACDKIQAAAERGIDAPIFRAPAWLLDGNTYLAAKDLDIALATHDTYRLPRTGIREYVYNNVQLRLKGTRAIHGHVTPVAGNYITDMDERGALTFGDKKKKREFLFCHEATILEPGYDA